MRSDIKYSTRINTKTDKIRSFNHTKQGWNDRSTNVSLSGQTQLLKSFQKADNLSRTINSPDDTLLPSMDTVPPTDPKLSTARKLLESRQKMANFKEKQIVGGIIEQIADSEIHVQQM